MFEEFAGEIIAGTGIPTATAAYFVIRHFWKKTQCFYLMKQKLEQHDKVIEKIQADIKSEIETSRNTHADLYNKIGDVTSLANELNGKMDTLLELMGNKKSD